MPSIPSVRPIPLPVTQGGTGTTTAFTDGWVLKAGASGVFTASSQLTFDGSNFRATFDNGGIFVATQQNILGTGDVFFQGIPSASGWTILEGYTGLGLVVIGAKVVLASGRTTAGEMVVESNAITIANNVLTTYSGNAALSHGRMRYTSANVWNIYTDFYSYPINIDCSTLSLQVTSGGAVNVGGHVSLASGKVYKVDGTQVVGAQGAAVADATGVGDVVAQLNTLLARLRTHGLIAS